ncbi:hypothetical protein AWB68_06071 [Caballeronia choica]|jgi:hypothetical protein|uniref:Uncharacterized protein n=1 Tax=Caballeronia choica TaxID=326476 RepID=A0A158KJG5_9BURK|nr:hypothetical protein [Caballeronia choica]SAL81247.1 hypothetical protein AWB68_06071 [Caballeronia choica]
MDMVLPPHRVLLSALVHGSYDDEARERIRRLFHSPLGVYVSHASRDHAELRVEFDVASEDLAFTIRTLRQVLPEAAVEEIRPLITTISA